MSNSMAKFLTNSLSVTRMILFYKWYHIPSISSKPHFLRLHHNILWIRVTFDFPIVYHLHDLHFLHNPFTTLTMRHDWKNEKWIPNEIKPLFSIKYISSMADFHNRIMLNALTVRLCVTNDGHQCHFFHLLSFSLAFLLLFSYVLSIVKTIMRLIHSDAFDHICCWFFHITLLIDINGLIGFIL